jgi:hypothetical protein
MHLRVERSRKADLLKAWGIAALGRGLSWEEVTKTMAKMKRKTVSEVETFIREDAA